MPYYVVLYNYTDQGAKTVKDSPTRIRENIRRAEEAGATVHGVYATMGQYDLVAIIESTTDEDALRAIFSQAMQGYARSLTMRAFSIDEFEDIIDDLP